MVRKIAHRFKSLIFCINIDVSNEEPVHHHKVISGKLYIDAFIITVCVIKNNHRLFNIIICHFVQMDHEVYYLSVSDIFLVVST